MMHAYITSFEKFVVDGKCELFPAWSAWTFLFYALKSVPTKSLFATKFATVVDRAAFRAEFLRQLTSKSKVVKLDFGTHVIKKKDTLSLFEELANSDSVIGPPAVKRLKLLSGKEVAVKVCSEEEELLQAVDNSCIPKQTSSTPEFWWSNKRIAKHFGQRKRSEAAVSAEERSFWASI